MQALRRPARPTDVHVQPRRLASHRRLVVAAMLVVLSLVGIAPASASAQLPPQGLYDACHPGVVPTPCDARVRLIGAAGFSLVLNYWMLAESSPQQILGYTNTAHASGVETIWPLNDWWESNPNDGNLLGSYPLLAQNCGCTTNAGLLAYVVGMAKSQPGTWGYYVADEPDSAHASQLANFVAEIKAVDPVHPVLIVALPGTLQTFAKIGDVLGGDTYPVTTQAVNDPSIATTEASATEQVQQAADAARVKSAMVLQAWNWDDSIRDSAGLSGVTHFPTTNEMIMMRNAALGHGHLSMILWWGMFDIEGYVPAEQPSYFLAPTNPADRWSSVLQAAFSKEPALAPVTRSPPSSVTTPPSRTVTAPKTPKRAPVAVATQCGTKVKPVVRHRRTGRSAIVHVHGSSPGRKIVRHRRLVGARRPYKCRAPRASRPWRRSTVVLRAHLVPADGMMV